jgi:hypothetical protein
MLEERTKRTVKKSHLLSTLSLMSFSALLGLNFPVAYADQAMALESQNTLPKTHPMASAQIKDSSGEKQHYQQELTLDHLRDAGLALHEIQRDVIYIFLEATRKPTLKTRQADIVIPSTISAKNLEDDSSFNPVRAEWLVYYIGILEPIIKLLENDVNDTRNGYRTLLIPEGAGRLAEPLWRTWANDVDKLNQRLSQLNDSIEETGKTQNTAIAREAAAMFEITQQMEKSRKKGYNLVRNFEVKRKVLSKTEL